MDDPCYILGAAACPKEARQAHDYIKVNEVRQAFCQLLSGVLSTGNAVRYSPHGKVEWAFQLGPTRHPAVRVTREWLAIYLTANDWVTIKSVDDLARRKYDNIDWPLPPQQT